MKRDIVLDTNVLISAFINPHGSPNKIVTLIMAGELRLCLDNRIFNEYIEVLSRPAFKFKPQDQNSFLAFIKKEGYFVLPPALEIQLPDPDDLMFIEVAVFTDSIIITGNKKHFLIREDIICTPAEFISKIIRSDL